MCLERWLVQDSYCLVGGGKDNYVRFLDPKINTRSSFDTNWDIETIQPVCTGPVTSICLSQYGPNSLTLLSSSYDARLRAHQLPTTPAQVIQYAHSTFDYHQIEAHAAPITTLSDVPGSNGRAIVTAAKDGSIRLHQVIHASTNLTVARLPLEERN